MGSQAISSPTAHTPGCAEDGLHRAPVARDRLSEYYWFCTEHVRRYNLAWDFFAGMNEQEIEYQRRFDTVWQRPSWPFGQFGQRAAGSSGGGAGYRMHDGFGFFSDQSQARVPASMLDSSFGTSATIVDLNLDGTLDIAKTMDGPVRVAYNTPSNVGVMSIVDTAYQQSAYHLTAADLNQDGRLDAIVSDDETD